MKRLQLIILLLAVCMFATACGEDELEITIKGNDTKAEPVSKPAPVKKEEPAVKEVPKKPVEEVNIDEQYPYKDVVVSEEMRKKIIEKLPKINSFDVNEAIKNVQFIRSSKEGQKVLFEIVSDKKSKLRRYASSVLASFCQKDYIPYLRRMINADEKDPVVLQNLMQALGSWTNHSLGLEYIYNIFKTTDSVWMKKNIAKLLHQLHTQSGIYLLIAEASDENAEVRRECIRSLGKIGWNAREPEPYKAALLDTIVNAMRNDPVENVRNEALTALTSIQNKEISPFLVEYFMNKDNYYEYRVKAIERLSRLSDDRFNDAVQIQLDDPVWKVRYQSIVTLGLLREEKALTKILDLYHNDKVAQVRLQAFISSAGFKDERVKKNLIDNLDNPDKMYAEAAIIHIVYQDDPSVLPKLVEKFDHKEASIRSLSYISVLMMSNQLNDYKYLDEYKRRLEIEENEELKIMLTEMIDTMNEKIEELNKKEGTQTQENKGTDTAEDKKSDDANEPATE